MDVFVSDIHLGTKDCRCDLLDAWLKENKKNIQNIYLVGDIIDMWRLMHTMHWPQSHVDFIRRILSLARAGKKYIML